MSQVELQIAKHAKSRRRGGPWDENALRSLLFGCWAQSAAVATGPIRVDGFSYHAILDKLRRLRQDAAMVSVLDLVTTIKDQDERDAVIKVNAFLPYPNPYNHITSHSSRQLSTPG